jgi:hypothetical protein
MSRVVLSATLLLGAACGGSGSDGGSPGPGPGPATREWTVMVYMAADNSLAADGIFDIDEMEAAGTNPAVQVVVQAEFSPDVIAQYNGCDASCFNRPNFNTFRYAITGQGSATTGPNGPALDIGNVNMTDPNQLKAFIQWAKQNYPANHYLLVLWNHGGGYTGLIQDQTSAGSDLMSLDEMRAGLTGVGPMDVVDFDMCLMAGYETLVKLSGLTDYAVFSEEVVPGEGNPYTSIIDGIQAAPTMDGRALAGMLVDRFDGYYQGNKASTTKSAYDLAGFAGFEGALNTLATDLTAHVATLAPTVSTAAHASQKFTIPELTDLVNFLDSLSTKVAGQTALQGEIAAVRAQATAGSFRINSRARTGNGQSQQGGVADVSRATGLHIVLPSGMGQDVFAQSGRNSLASYQALFQGKPWAAFLAAYAGSQTATEVVDQGDNRFEAYLVWESGAVAAGADVDFWVLEPDGNIYIPSFGSVTPNGTMSNDSWGDGVNFEGYLTNRYVQPGDYVIFASLFQDPQNFQPVYDLAYRYDQTGNFSLLYAGQNLPQPLLSKAVSWLNDPTPTLTEIYNGAYTDLRYVGTQTFTLPAPGLRAEPSQLLASRGAAVRSGSREISPAQMATIQRVATARRLGQAPHVPSRLGLWDLPFGRAN